MSGNKNDIKSANTGHTKSVEFADSVETAETAETAGNDAIHIRSASSTNGITTLIIGGALAFVGLIAIKLLPPLFFLVGILFMSGSIVALVMGYYKIKEPKHSLEITKESITYHHRRGKWVLPWSNIQRVDVPKVHKGLEHVELEMVGFRLRDPESFLEQISPRLVTHLLMEQKPLVTQIIMSDCNSGQCAGDDIIEDVKYKCTDGSMLTGVNAMFANRMRKLKEGLGYDIYIAVNELDREPKAFVNLIRECQDTVAIAATQ